MFFSIRIVPVYRGFDTNRYIHRFYFRVGNHRQILDDTVVYESGYHEFYAAEMAALKRILRRFFDEDPTTIE